MRQCPRHLPPPLIAERGRYFYAPVHSRRWPIVAAVLAVAALWVAVVALGAAAWECAL